MKIVFDILMAQLLGNKRDAAACVYFFLPPKVGILSYSIFILRFMSQCYHICVLHLQMKDSSFPKPFQRGRFPYSYYWIILFGLLYVLNREAINLGLVKKKAAYHNHSKGNYPAVIFLHNHFRGFNHFVKDQTSSFLACWFHAHYLRSGLRLSDWFGNCRRLLLHPSVLLGHQGT